MTMIPDPPSGYRTVNTDHDLRSWRHRLFSEIRKAPLYKKLAGETPEDAVRRLRLVRDGTSCPWAVEMIHDDRAGRFLEDRTPPHWGMSVHRNLDIRASLAGMRVDTRRTLGPHGERLSAVTHLLHTPKQIAAADWDELERLAVDAARQAVEEMRHSFETRQVPGQITKRIKAGSLPGRELAIQRLAFRLTGRGGTPNTAKVDRDWCDTLGIDRLGK